MRPKERIPIFFNYHIIDKLHDNGVFSDEEFISISKNYNKIEEYWNKYPDQRFFQVLINLNLIKDDFKLWMTEEWEILRDQGIAPEEFLFWTSYYDKNNEPLDEPKTRLIKDLCKSHVRNIIKFLENNGKTFDGEYNSLVKQAFDNVLNNPNTPEKYE